MSRLQEEIEVTDDSLHWLYWDRTHRCFNLKDVSSLSGLQIIKGQVAYSCVHPHVCTKFCMIWTHGTIKYTLNSFMAFKISPIHLQCQGTLDINSSLKIRNYKLDFNLEQHQKFLWILTKTSKNLQNYSKNREKEKPSFEVSTSPRRELWNSQ